MTVDSEAIFALMEHRRHDARALSEMRGAMAAAWLDEREGTTLYLARGRLRPLWLGRTAEGLYFASTRRALTIAAAALKTRVDVRQVREGRLLHVAAGRVVRERRFRPDRGTASPTTSRPSELHGRRSPAWSASPHSRQSAPPSEPSGRDLDAVVAQAVRGRGTGTPSRHRAERRAAGTPAIRTGATDRRAGPPPSRPSSAVGRVANASRAPWSTARSRRSSPWSTSNPASRRAFPSEPNVWAYSDADGIERPRAARSRAVGVRPRSSPSASELLDELLAGEKAPREQARCTLGRVPRTEVLDDRLGCTRASGSCANSRIVGDLPGARRPTGVRRGSPRRCSDGACLRERRRALPRRCARAHACVSADAPSLCKRA